MFGVHSQRDRGTGTEPGQQQAERSRTAVGTAAVDRFVAAQRMACRVDAHAVRLFLTCHRGGGEGVVTVVAHHAILDLCAFAGRKPRRADAEHSFIVTVMKPVVHVPWYQVLLWILSAGADCLLAAAAIIVAPCEELRPRPGAGPSPASPAARSGCRPAWRESRPGWIGHQTGRAA